LKKILGKCPYCSNGQIESRDIQVDGKALKLYACSNAHWHYEGDFAELTGDSTCSFRIFQNQLQRWNKKKISEKEIRMILVDGQMEVEFYSARVKKTYKKSVVLDEEYGISVEWDKDI
jgi:hypothetical protein